MVSLSCLFPLRLYSILLFFSFCLFFVNAASDDYYTAAVVEFVPIDFASGVAFSYSPPSLSIDQVKMINLKRFAQYIHTAKQQGADIILFPEDCVTGWPTGYSSGRDGALPWLESIPNIGSVPSDSSDLRQSSPTVYWGSSFAKQYEITVVLDMGEVVWCNGTSNLSETIQDKELIDHCPDDGRWQFNTLIAFGTQGEILAIHRKLHLFLADTEIFNYPLPKLDRFMTSFGVEFGMMVCFDVWFRVPSFALMKEFETIQNFVLSSWWENNGTLPLITAVNMQQGFARAAKSNLLACSVGVGLINSGSGIYNGYSGSKTYTYYPYPHLNETLLIKQLPKFPRNTSDPVHAEGKIIPMNTFEMIPNIWKEIVHQNTDHQSNIESKKTSNNWIYGRDYHEYARANQISMPKNATIQSFTLSVGETQEFELTNGYLSCSFSIYALDSGINSTYAVMAYQGPYFDDLLYADVCAIYHCVNSYSTNAPCEYLTLKSGGLIESFSISGSFKQTQPVYAMASQNRGVLLDANEVTVLRSSSSSTMRGTRANSGISLVNAVLYAQQSHKFSPLYI